MSIVLLIVVSLVGFRAWSQTTQPNNTQLQHRIPPQGVVENDTGGKVPGNPENGIQDLKQIYRAIAVFRRKHDGKYPPSAFDLRVDVASHLRDYGFNSEPEGHSIFTNPDTRFSDNDMSRNNPDIVIAYDVFNKRPNGVLVGSPKPSDTKDVLASTSLYFHQNVRLLPDGSTTVNPVGFYLLLWDDGSVQKIPYYSALYVPKGNGEYSIAYPGQAGIPSSAKTYDQFYTKVVGFKTPPRGKVGEKGLSYKGTSNP